MVNFVHFIPGVEVLGFTRFAKGSMTSECWVTFQKCLPTTPWPSLPSHCLCPARITYHRHSFNSLPRVMLALGVTCSPRCCQKALPKMQPYPHCCSACRTTVVPKGHQNKNLNWVYPTSPSITWPFSVSSASKLTVLLIFQPRVSTRTSVGGIKLTSVWYQITWSLDKRKTVSHTNEKGPCISVLTLNIYSLDAFLNPLKTHPPWPYTQAPFSNGNQMWFILVFRTQLLCIKHQFCPSQCTKCSDISGNKTQPQLLPIKEMQIKTQWNTASLIVG